MARARRIERFLSPAVLSWPSRSPARRATFTKLEDTIRSFEELCDGKWDHLPEGAFMYVGAIEEAQVAADEAAKKAGGR